LTSAPRAAGPLAGHTPHRTITPGSGAPPRPGDSAQADFRPNPATPPPLRRSDYISPAGTRQPLAGRGGLSTGTTPPARRVGVEQGAGAEAARREAGLRPASGSRPLPPIAAPLSPAPAPRRPDAGRASGADVKSQKAEKKFTREELQAMVQSGQIPGVGAAARPGAAPRAGAGTQGAPRGASAPIARRPQAAAAPATAPAPPVIDDEEERKNKGGRLGTAGERASRRARRTERANERRGLSTPVPASTLLEGEEETRRSRGPRRSSHKAGGRAALAPTRKSHVEIEVPISVRSLSEAIGIQANSLIRKLVDLGQLVTKNATIDEELAAMLAMEFGVELEIVHERTVEDELIAEIEAQGQSEEGLVPRPPVVTILGHVDHGKTSLLDRIRKSNVVQSESGGITQHIGAYQVEHDGKKITFVDTPGHEAFTAMRARGANVTDIVVLVVAADDGVMPQTREAIAHAKAAEVPVVVALNKIDLPNADASANVQRIYAELSQENMIPEEYGGDTPVVKTSTLTSQGITDLLATIELMAEVSEPPLRADPNRAATGTCLESSKSEGRGVVATVLVQDGTLHVGDVMVCGDGYGRVRALFNDQGRMVQEAGPSTPVEVSGLDEVPTAGERFAVLDDISRAREIAQDRRGRARGEALGDRQAVTLENLFSKMAEQQLKSLNLILKADVQGSLEALAKELEKLQNDEVPIRILHKAVGGIGESDILLADASEAIVVGFRVAPEDRAISLAEEKKIDVRRYDIIYQVTDEIKKAVEGLLVPELKEVHLGYANVRQVFKISKVGSVAGCVVTRGTIERGAKARVSREGRVIYQGTIDALKRFKNDVKEVGEGFECGIKVSNFDDVKVDDSIEAYRIDVIRRTLPA
jgi:translation initiation factor IF-2